MEKAKACSPAGWDRSNEHAIAATPAILVTRQGKVYRIREKLEPIAGSKRQNLIFQLVKIRDRQWKTWDQRRMPR